MDSPHPSGESLTRIRPFDIRVIAAAIAAVLLIGGVMWVVPTTPNSQSFQFDASRRDVSAARPIEFGTVREGTMVDGSDVDFYRLDPAQGPRSIAVHMASKAPKMIPALVIFDAAGNLVQDKTAEYTRKPGADIETSFEAKPGTIYYVQVFTQRNTTGTYTLTVAERQP